MIGVSVARGVALAFLGGLLPLVVHARSGYGDFSSEQIEGFFEYIHSQEVIEIAPTAEFRSAVSSIPMNLETQVTLQQAKALQSWLSEFLLAFSRHGDAGSVGDYYTREGEITEKGFAILARFLKRNEGVIVRRSAPSIRDGFTLYHKRAMESLGKTRYLERVSFEDSAFRIFRMTGDYSGYFRHARSRGWLPRGHLVFNLGFVEEAREALQQGESILCAEILFITEEPEEERGGPVAGRMPSFFRMIWDYERGLWRHGEVFFSPGIAVLYAFNML